MSVEVATRDDIEAWIASAALGDRDAFERLYAATSAKLFGICLRVLSTRSEAEEALQEVFLKVWNNADRYKAGGTSPMTWLITIARNHAIDRLRARRAQAGRSQGEGLEAAEIVADDGPGPEALAIAADERGRIATCLGELEPDKSEAVRLAYLQGETYADLSERFGVPLNTMRTWLRRSLLKLRECLTR